MGTSNTCPICVRRIDQILKTRVKDGKQLETFFVDFVKQKCHYDSLFEPNPFYFDYQDEFAYLRMDNYWDDESVNTSDEESQRLYVDHLYLVEKDLEKKLKRKKKKSFRSRVV
eukprot:TRINITY_DN3385_c0_g1_i1.p1 TRINITY_DN3385_c0_g1~~TRINITY_DN3385_c0_g1_i1.p1  ORF type:complete len:113 (-),score=16.44 TRINITY_DN3385_c0_g1_i1:11-349(-)